MNLRRLGFRRGNPYFGLSVLAFIVSSGGSLAVAGNAPSSPTTEQKNNDQASDHKEIQEPSVKNPVAKPVQSDVTSSQAEQGAVMDRGIKNKVPSPSVPVPTPYPNTSSRSAPALENISTQEPPETIKERSVHDKGSASDATPQHDPIAPINIK
jgi:hypothetical protein